MAYNSVRTLRPLAATRPKGAAPVSERERKAPLPTENVSDVLKFHCPYKEPIEVTRALLRGEIGPQLAWKYSTYLEDMQRRWKTRKAISEQPQKRYDFRYFSGYDK